MRTDDNNNPAAIITQLAAQGGLIEGVDYVQGTPFEAGGVTYYTAKLLGDPIALTIKVIDKVHYKTASGAPRWPYADLPNWVWNGFTTDQKRDMIGYHYMMEGGTAMRGLFPRFGQA